MIDKSVVKRLAVQCGVSNETPSEPYMQNLIAFANAIKAAEFERGVTTTCDACFTTGFSEGKRAGREERDNELMGQEPVGYVRVYGVECLHGTLMNEITGRVPLPSSTTIDPYKLAEDDIALYAKPFPQQKSLSAEYIEQHIGCDEGDRKAVTAIVRETEAAHGITEKE
jgi:hypothetical protein